MSATAQKLDIVLSDETFADRQVTLFDPKVTGAQIIQAAGASPASEFVVLQHLKSGALESIRPDEVVDLITPGRERFFVIRGSLLYRFFLNEVSMEWPKAKIAGRGLLNLARQPDHDEVVLERSQQPDQVIGPDDEARLDGKAVEKFKTRKSRSEFHIFVNARPRVWGAREISFDDLLKLAYDPVPTGPYIIWDVTYDKGPPANPRGSLVQGQSVEVKNGMRFGVYYTDKS